MKLVDLEKIASISNELRKYVGYTTNILRCLEGNGLGNSEVYEIIKTMRTQLGECDIKFNSLDGSS